MLARSVAFSIGGQAGSLLVGFAASVVLARALGPSDRGFLGVLVASAFVALAFTALGLPQAVNYYSSRSPEWRGALAGNSLAYAGVLAVLLVPLAFALGYAFSTSRPAREGGLWALAALLVPLMLIRFASTNALAGMLRFGLTNVLYVASRMVVLVGILVLVVIASLAVTGGLLATALGEIFVIACALAALVRHHPLEVDRKTFRAMVGYGARVEVGAVFQMLSTRLDIVVLQFFRPLSEVGYYVVAVFVAELVVNLSRAFQAVVQPVVAREEAPSGGLSRELATELTMRHHALLGVAATAVNAVVGYLVILLAYGPSFHPALGPFWILLPGMFFLGIGLVVAGDLSGRGRPGLSSALAGGAAGATIVLDLLLIPPLGMTGAAIASLVAYALFGLASVFALSRVSGSRLRALAVPRRVDLGVYRRGLVGLLGRVGSDPKRRLP